MTSQDTQPTVETGYVEIPGGRMYYEVAGAGHPFLMIHADVADHRMWDEQFATFARHYRAIRYDKRGFGKTTSQDGPVSLRDDIVALLKHLGVAQTYIMGLSNGGSLALTFTLEHPELVDALIVVAGGVSGYEAPATEAEMALFERYEALEASNDTAELIALGVHVWCDGPEQPEGRAAPEVRERIREMMTDIYRDHHEQLQPIRLEPPAVGRLEEIRVPTLAVFGTYDETGTIASMEYLAEHVRGARKAAFDTAHMVNMEQPERFDALVLDFLKQAPA
jgi:3-oxoadipate enol-lactonase